jgi:DTW domain-containing protein YfiP
VPLPRCPACLLPDAICICGRIRRVVPVVPIVVVRHARETFKVSNSGKLVVEVTGARLISHGTTREDTVVDGLGDSPVVLFPGGRPLEAGERPSALVVVDGTWTQARRMRQSIPDLARCPGVSVVFNADRPRMRTAGAAGMSTLEAVADALELLGDTEAPGALREIFDEVTARWLYLRQRPDWESHPPSWLKVPP